MAGDVLQEVLATPEENDRLKRLTRRRRRLVEERGRVISAMQADLQATAPGLLQITKFAGNLWFLNFLTCRTDIRKLARVRRASLLKRCPIGRRDDLPRCQAGSRVEPTDQDPGRRDGADRRPIGDRQPAHLDPGLRHGLKRRTGRRDRHNQSLQERFKSEASLALYLGMASLDNSSGKFRGSKAPKHVNARAKTAMMMAVDHHRKRVGQSQRYYQRKRAQGKRHNQAIRALGRHLCRVIFKMLTEDRPYRIDP
jgi:hypothetical protein